MTVPAQFNFIDGGERCTNNSVYYASCGVSTNFSPVYVGAPAYAKPFFRNGTWSPPSIFSSVSVYHGFRGYLVNSTDVSFIQYLNVNGRAQFTVSFNNNGSISVSSGGVLLGTSSISLIVQQTVFFLEVEAVVSATVGACKIFVNGNPVPCISIAGANMAADTSSLPVTSFEMTTPNDDNNLYWRDMYCHDGTGAAPFNGPLGNGGCEVLAPDANVAVAFAPNGNAANWENAAETPPNPSVDFNSSATVGAQDAFKLAALPADVLSVIAVKVFNYSSKNDTGARAMQNVLTSDGVTVDGTSTYLNETPVVIEDTFIQDPSTSAPFTVAGVNALVVGYKISA